MARWAVPEDLHSRVAPGPLCPFREHVISSVDGEIPRYDDSHACVHCVAALNEGRISLDIRRILPRMRRRFLEFWSLVEVRSMDECWPWRGPLYRDGSSSYFPMPRHWSTSRQFSAPRVATWFSWGDIGRLPIENICGNKLCCNPLHIRVRGITHFHHRRRLASVNFVASTSQLIDDTSEFLLISHEQAPERLKRLERLSADWIKARIEADGALPLDFSPSGRET
jgi:hypothetical protein